MSWLIRPCAIPEQSVVDDDNYFCLVNYGHNYIKAAPYLYELPLLTPERYNLLKEIFSHLKLCHLTLKELKYLYINHGDQRVWFQIEKPHSSRLFIQTYFSVVRVIIALDPSAPLRRQIGISYYYYIIILYFYLVDGKCEIVKEPPSRKKSNKKQTTLTTSPTTVKVIKPQAVIQQESGPGFTPIHIGAMAFAGLLLVITLLVGSVVVCRKRKRRKRKIQSGNE